MWGHSGLGLERFTGGAVEAPPKSKLISLHPEAQSQGCSCIALPKVDSGTRANRNHMAGKAEQLAPSLQSSPGEGAPILACIMGRNYFPSSPLSNCSAKTLLSFV